MSQIESLFLACNRRICARVEEQLYHLHFGGVRHYIMTAEIICGWRKNGTVQIIFSDSVGQQVAYYGRVSTPILAKSIM